MCQVCCLLLFSHLALTTQKHFDWAEQHIFTSLSHLSNFFVSALIPIKTKLHYIQSTYCMSFMLFNHINLSHTLSNVGLNHYERNNSFFLLSNSSVIRNHICSVSFFHSYFTVYDNLNTCSSSSVDFEASVFCELSKTFQLIVIESNHLAALFHDITESWI